MENKPTTFVIAGREYAVPPLNLYLLDQCKDEINALDPGLAFVDYSKSVLKIVATSLDQPELLSPETMKNISIPEMRGLVTSMSDLLTNSGFQEATVAIPGTGTSNLSSPNSLQTES